jgi:hypothetical protein
MFFTYTSNVYIYTGPDTTTYAVRRPLLMSYLTPASIRFLRKRRPRAAPRPACRSRFVAGTSHQHVRYSRSVRPPRVRVLGRPRGGALNDRHLFFPSPCTYRTYCVQSFLFSGPKLPFLGTYCTCGCTPAILPRGRVREYVRLFSLLVSYLCHVRYKTTNFVQRTTIVTKSVNN